KRMRVRSSANWIADRRGRFRPLRALQNERNRRPVGAGFFLSGRPDAKRAMQESPRPLANHIAIGVLILHLLTVEAGYAPGVQSGTPRRTARAGRRTRKMRWSAWLRPQRAISMPSSGRTGS